LISKEIGYKSYYTFSICFEEFDFEPLLYIGPQTLNLGNLKTVRFGIKYSEERGICSFILVYHPGYTDVQFKASIMQKQVRK